MLNKFINNVIYYEQCFIYPVSNCYHMVTKLKQLIKENTYMNFEIPAIQNTFPIEIFQNCLK